MPPTPRNQIGSRQRSQALQEAHRSAIRGRELGIIDLLPLQQFVQRHLRMERLAHTEAQLRASVIQGFRVRDDDEDASLLEEMEIAQTAVRELLEEGDGENREEEEAADEEEDDDDDGVVVVVDVEASLGNSLILWEENIMPWSVDTTVQHTPASTGEPLQQAVPSMLGGLTVYLGPANRITSVYPPGFESATPESFMNYLASLPELERSQPPGNSFGSDPVESITGTNRADTYVPVVVEGAEIQFSQSRRDQLMVRMMCDIHQWIGKRERATFIERG